MLGKIKQLERSSPATDEELKQFREKYIEAFTKSDGIDTFAVIDELTDDKISYRLLALQTMMGQSGIHFTSFGGFYYSYEKAKKRATSWKVSYWFDNTLFKTATTID